MATEYRIEFMPGRRKPGADECDQGWERVRKEKGLDYTNLIQVMNEAHELDSAWDGMFEHRVVEVNLEIVDRFDVVARLWRKVEVDVTPAKAVA